MGNTKRVRGKHGAIASIGREPEVSKVAQKQILQLNQSGLYEWWWTCSECQIESDRFIYGQSAVISGYWHLRKVHGMSKDETLE